MQKTSDGVSQCTPSVECATTWAQEAAAVVDIYAIDMRLGAMGLCTGEGELTGVEWVDEWVQGIGRRVK